HWIALSLRLAECSTVDGIDDGASVGQLDPLPGAIGASAPSGVYQPHACAVLFHFGGKQFGIFAWMPHKERATKTGRKRCRGFFYSDLGAGYFRGIAADVMIHRLGRRERTDRWKHAERVAGQKNNIRRVACNAWNFRVLDEFYRISAASVL